MPDLRTEIIGHIKSAVAGDEEAGLFRPPLVGFSSADDPAFEEIPRLVGPHHLRPRDILPEVETVVSFFIPFSAPVVKNNQGDGPVSREWGLAYLAANVLINRVSASLVGLVEAAGGRAASVPATHTFDKVTLKTAWSHRSAAWVAGLGRFGLNRMLIGPAGGAGRYGTVFISPKLAADARSEEEYCLHLKGDRCGACVRACPVGALTVEGYYDRYGCYKLLQANNEYLNLDGRLANVCGKCVVVCPRARA